MAAASRKKILARYRRLRAISTDHHENALELVSEDALIRTARTLGLAVGNSFFEDSLAYIDLAFDLLLYTAARGRTRGLDRYAKSAPPKPGSDEAVVLAAMRNDCFSVWQVQGRHEIAGIVVRNTTNGEEGWLLDTGLECSVSPGACFAARLVKPDNFMMTSGIIVPVLSELLEAVLDEMPKSLRLAPPATVLQHQQFATVLYRIALQTGILSCVFFKPVEPRGGSVAPSKRSGKPEPLSSSKRMPNRQLALNLNGRAG